MEPGMLPASPEPIPGPSRPSQERDRRFSFSFQATIEDGQLEQSSGFWKLIEEGGRTKK
jgi:hypothetical protein